MVNSLRVISVPKTEKSAIDYLLKTISCTQINSYNYIVVKKSVLSSMESCPVLKNNDGIWHRKPMVIHREHYPELYYQVVPLNVSKGIYMVSWIKYADLEIHFSLKAHGRGISLFCASKERKRLYT